MFTPFVVLSCAAAAFAGPLKRFDGLTVSVTGPAAKISSVDDLKFTASVTNTGTEDVKVLKYGTILDEGLPTKSFAVTKDGEPVSFTGVKLSVSLEDAGDAAYTSIAAGETVTVDHDVSTLFDFGSAGEGTFKFLPVTNFYVAPTLARVTSVAALDKVSASTNSVEVTISGDLAKRELHRRNKRATDICTDASQKSFIDASYTEAKALASGASSYIASNGADSLYEDYYSTNSQSAITDVFDAVASESSSTRTLSCEDDYDVCGNGVIAYTLIATTNIYFCDIFFDEVATPKLCSGTTVASRNIRGGTTLHELTHALSDTDDVGYGCSADQALSASDQLINADNYNCFSTQVYADTEC